MSFFLFIFHQSTYIFFEDCVEYQISRATLWLQYLQIISPPPPPTTHSPDSSPCIFFSPVLLLILYKPYKSRNIFYVRGKCKPLHY